MKSSSLSMSQDFPRRMASPYRPPPRGDFHPLQHFFFISVCHFSRLIQEHVFSIQLHQSPNRTIVPDLNADRGLQPARSPAIDTGIHEGRLTATLMQLASDSFSRANHLPAHDERKVYSVVFHLFALFFCVELCCLYAFMYFSFNVISENVICVIF